MKNEDLHNALIENKNRNKFYKKETILIGFMTLSIFIFLFGFFKWQNSLSLFFFCLSIFLVTISLYRIFNKREIKYYELINKLITEQENSISSEIKNQAKDIITVSEREFGTSDLIFEKKVANIIMHNLSISYEPEYPFNTPISKILRDRTENRKKRLEDFNYKFRNSISLIEDIEKQPAYKRIGISFDDSEKHSFEILSENADMYLAMFSTNYIDHICNQYYSKKINKEQLKIIYILYYDYLKKNHPILTKTIDTKSIKKADNLISKILNE